MLYLYYYQYHLINHSNSQSHELFHGIYLLYLQEFFHLRHHILYLRYLRQNLYF
nr:MAG TPA: hypothetical protein [Caudoviricetes sp.]